MQVVYTHDIFSRQSRGGISRYYVELLRHLSSGPNNVRVLAGSHWNGHLQELEGHPAIDGGYESAATWNRPYRRILNRRQQARFAPVDQNTIVHHTYYSFFRPMKSARMVATIHDLIPEFFPRQYSWKARFLTEAKRRTCHAADVIISISHTTKSDLVAFFGIPEEKIIVTHLGTSLSPEVFPDEPSPYPFPYFLYVGGRGGYKNCDTLWRAFACSERLQKDFHIVCLGGGELSKPEQTLLAELGIQDRVHQVSGDDQVLANHYRHATAFVYPSRYEGFGISPLEAMSFGTPVIVSTGGSIPEVVGDCGQYFEPDRIEDLTELLEQSAGSSDLSESEKDTLRMHARKFRWETTAAQTCQAYEKIAA